MAIDQVREEWHLTPRGWVRGNWAINKPLGGESSPPADRVETWVQTQTTPDADFSRTQYQWSLIWASPQHSEADRKALRATIRHSMPDSENANTPSWEFPLQ